MDACEVHEHGSIEVLLVPENPINANVSHLRRVRLSQDGALLGGLTVDGRLLVGAGGGGEAGGDGGAGGGGGAGGDGRARCVALEGSYTDFAWEELAVLSPAGMGCRLLALTNQGARLLLVQQDSSTLCVTHMSAFSPGEPEEPHPLLHLLSFLDGRTLLLQGLRLLSLHWGEGGEEPLLSSCRLLLPQEEQQEPICAPCLSGGVLHLLSHRGVLYMCDLAGRLLAQVALTSDLVSAGCLLQVSADLCTAVICQSHSALAVSLQEHLSLHPDHLLCAETSRDLQRAAYPTDRSWEDRLSFLSSRVKPQVATPSVSPWLHQVTPTRIPLPAGRAEVRLHVPQSSSLALLSLSPFSAVFTLVSPGDGHTTVALWEFESQRVSYHRTGGVAQPIHCCGETSSGLLLTRGSVLQVLFSVQQQDLLTSLMLFGDAATVDAVCHLNRWGRCSIPLHTLQAGLKNRQLDMVDFYLKSKEDLLSLSEEAPPTNALIQGLQELRPALDLLCSTISESHSDAKHFSDQLRHTALRFLHTHTHSLLTHTHALDSIVQQAVCVLHQYICQVRTFMRRSSWTEGALSSIPPLLEEDPWDRLTTEHLLQKVVLSREVCRLQAFLRSRNRPEQTISDLKRMLLPLVFCCLAQQHLQQASTLLRNMGFSVKKHLHIFCLYTNNSQLRDFLVEELSRRSYLSGAELQSVAFIGQMMTSQASGRWRQPVVVETGLAMAGAEPGSRAVLEELMGGSSSQEESALDSTIRLDWVTHWDQSSQQAILISRLEEPGPCYAVPVLWAYLTSLHDGRRLACWLRGLETAELGPDLLEDHTLCCPYLKELLLDLLSRKGVFSRDELSALGRRVWRLAQCGGVMGPAPPPPDLHGPLISTCLQNSLQYLLYSYLHTHRLTSGSPLLATGCHDRPAWFSLMQTVQDISTHPADPGPVLQTSITSAQVLLPVEASVSSLVTEGHSLLALSSVMFCPGGVDQVLCDGGGCDQGGRDQQGRGQALYSLDPQLLKMALGPHPKLKAALFPAGGRGHAPPSDITVYQLMQSLCPLDASRLFHWQSANSLRSNCTNQSETDMPHFASSSLVGRSLTEHLDFLFYLSHGRPSHAYCTFLMDTTLDTQTPLLLARAAKQACCLALRHFSQAGVCAACVCFCELLGVCSAPLRTQLNALDQLMEHWTQTQGEGSPGDALAAMAVRLAGAEPGAAAELIGHLEVAVIDSLEKRGVARSSYEASLAWAEPVHFCRMHSLAVSGLYPAHCAEDGQLLHFLLFVQLHGFPAVQVLSLAGGFSPTVRAHLGMALEDLREASVGRSQQEEQGAGDLLQLVGRSQEEARPWRSLLEEGLWHRCPTLSLLASCMEEAEPIQCLCVWVLTSVDDVTAGEAMAHLDSAPRHHQWTLHDLSIIWRTLLGRGQIRPLLRGFQLFQRDCPLLLVVEMFSLCCDSRRFSEAKNKLLEFQRRLITMRSSSSLLPAGGLPLRWVESQASLLLLMLLQSRASSPYDLHRLLLLLADVEHLLKSNGPDFKSLSRLSSTLQGCPVSIPPTMLQGGSQLAEGYQEVVQRLQDHGLWEAARQVSQLGGLPGDQVLINQLLQEVTSQRAERRWQRREAREAFWRRSHFLFQGSGTEPQAASSFFLEQAGEEGGKGEEEGGEGLLNVQEQQLLLSLSAHWLARCCPPPLPLLQRLEARFWRCRAREHLLLVAMETDNLFAPPPAGPDDSSFNALLRQLSFARLDCLDQEHLLMLEGLGEEAGEASTPPLSPEERQALGHLIGQLLDEGGVYQASRLCRYFRLPHPDLLRLLTCRGLASGALAPPPMAPPPLAPPPSGLVSSSSFSSLSSLELLSQSEDLLVSQLQALVDQCRHGYHYCKQVVGLYQLSKELGCSFEELASQEPLVVLEEVLRSSLPERLRRAEAFVRAQGLQAPALASLLARTLTQDLLGPPGPPPDRHVYRQAEGRESFVQLARLTEPNLLGQELLENIKSLAHTQLATSVELLILAHDCFTQTSNMEGIVRVLQAARHLSHTYLAPGEHYALLVRVLTGIGRYNDMTYVFDLLHQNHRFETLLRKRLEPDRGQRADLRAALLDYIKRCLPGDSEKYNMVALCFSMRREIAENHEMAAHTQLRIIQAQAWALTSDLKGALLKVLGLLKDAAESYAKDTCVRAAARCVRTAKLIQLQIHFLEAEPEMRIINLQPAELPGVLLKLAHCYQVCVVAEAYQHSVDWAELLFNKVLLNGDFTFLTEVQQYRPISTALYQDVCNRLNVGGASGVAMQNLRRFLGDCKDVYTHYRLAYQHGLQDVTISLLQDARTSCYLSDRLGS